MGFEIEHFKPSFLPIAPDPNTGIPMRMEPEMFLHHFGLHHPDANGLGLVVMVSIQSGGEEVIKMLGLCQRYSGSGGLPQ
jgi:hypothetical protein